MMIVRKINVRKFGKINRKLAFKFFSLFLVALTLVGLTFGSSTSSVNYEANAHDDQFAEMFSYKIEGIISDRGESSRILIVEKLREFALNFSDEDPRFAYIIWAVADIVEATDSNAITNIFNSGANLKAKNALNESNSVLWITDVSQYKNSNNKTLNINLTMIHNPYKTPYAEQISNSESGNVDSQIHCNIYADSPFSGSSTSPGITGPRGRPYGMTYSHVNLIVDNSINFSESENIDGSFKLPELPNNTYTLMCSIVISDSNSIAYRSAYYYFDVDVK